MPDRPPNRDRESAGGEATKVCPSCGRPFVNRHKWRDRWESVIDCSERCRRAKPPRPPEG